MRQWMEQEKNAVLQKDSACIAAFALPSFASNRGWPCVQSPAMMFICLSTLGAILVVELRPVLEDLSEVFACDEAGFKL